MTDIPLEKRIAFYTIFCGGESNWANIIPDVPHETCACYYFTNNRNTYNRVTWSSWQYGFLDIPIYEDPIKDADAAIDLRIRPHLSPILNKYDYTCYFDSKLQCKGDKVVELIRELDQSDKCAIFSKHAHGDEFRSVWDEYNLCIQYPKYELQKDQYKAYLDKYLSQGFSDHIDTHYCTGFIIRKNTPKITEMCDLWYEHIKECGINTQISFSLIQQLYKDLIKPVDWLSCYQFM
jgi:hypothetical protein